MKAERFIILLSAHMARAISPYIVSPHVSPPFISRGHRRLRHFMPSLSISAARSSFQILPQACRRALMMVTNIDHSGSATLLDTAARHAARRAPFHISFAFVASRAVILPALCAAARMPATADFEFRLRATSREATSIRAISRLHDNIS